MAQRQSSDSKILLCLGLVVVSSSFCLCTPLGRLTPFDKLGENSTLSKDQAKRSDLQHGKLLIGKKSLHIGELRETNATQNSQHDDTDYQDDMGWGEHKQPGQVDGFLRPNLMPDSSVLDRLLKLEPKVECTGDSMKLQVQDTASSPGSLIFVDRGSRLSPLPLSKLPQSCGYTIRSTREALFLAAPYDGCFVALEEDSYVLPLRWWGLPVRMSCPLMMQTSPNPPMVTCHAKGMIVKTGWALSVAKIYVTLNGKWEPLMKASARCGFGVVEHPEGVVISVNYAPCLEIKDGMYILELAGEGENKVSCPPLSPAQTEHTKMPVSGPKQQIEMPSKGVYLSPTSLIEPAQSAIPQVPDIPKNPEEPNPNQGPKDTSVHQFHYYPHFFNHYPAKPDPKLTTTTQPQTDPPTEQLVTVNGQVPQKFITLPWPALPEEVPVLPPTPQKPIGQGKQPFYPYPFYIKPPSLPPKTENPPTLPPISKLPPGHQKPFKPQTMPPQKPAGQPTKGVEQKPFNQFPFYPLPPQLPTSGSHQATPLPEQPQKPSVSKEPQGQIYQPFYLYPHPHHGPYQPPQQHMPSPPPPKGQVRQPLGPVQPENPQGQNHQTVHPYPWPKPEKPTVAPKPSQPQGQVQQPFHPYPWSKPEKPTVAPKPPQPEAPQGQVQQPFFPYPWPQPEKPPVAPKPETTQGQVQQPFFPYPWPQPEKPAVAPKPETTQGQVQQPFFPYPWPQPEKPAVAPKPETTQGQVQQPFFPYPWPQPEKPTVAPKPPQPEAPQGQVQQPFFPYPWPQPEKPTVAPKPQQPETTQGQVQQPFFPYPWPEPEKPAVAPKPETTQGQVQQPFFPHPRPQPEKPTVAPKPPQPEAPQGQVQQPFFPYPWPQPEKPAVAPKPETTQGQVQQPFFPHPLPEPEKSTVAPKPPQPEAPQGQVQQPFFPYPWPQPEKPTVAPEPPQPEAPQGQVQQPFFPYPWPQPEKPAVAPKPETTQGQVQQPFFPYPRPQPEKPTVAPKPPQPEAPQGQVQQPFFPYPLPQPEKPTIAPKPPQPETPQGQVQQPFYLYPWPEPETKPPQPEAPQGQVQQTFFPYPWPQPEKPTVAPKPETTRGQVQQPFFPYPWPQPEKPAVAPKPETTQGQVQQPFFPYPRPQPEKPTVAPKPPQPEAPQGQVQQPFFPYPLPQPEKPTVAPKPPQPETPQGQVQQPFYLYPWPEPETKPPQPEAPQGQVQQPFFPYPLPEPEKPTVAPKPPQPEIPQGQVQQPFFPYPWPEPEKPTVAPKPPQPEAPQGQVQQPFFPYPWPEPKKPTVAPKPPKQSTTKGLQSGSSHMPLVYCPQFCPSNCCPQIAFHQHLHQVIPVGSKDAASLYPGLPFLPSMAYSEFNGSSDAQKPTEAGKKQTVISPPISFQSVPSGNDKLLYGLPAAGKPAVLLHNPSRPTNQEQPYSFLPNSYPDWPYLVPNEELQKQPSHIKAGESQGLLHPKFRHEHDDILVPYYMHQDAQAQIYDKSTAMVNASQPQPFERGTKEFNEQERTVHSFSEPKSYVLLQHGPPGGESDSLNETPLLNRDASQDVKFLAQNPVRNKRKTTHKNPKPQQENPPHPIRLGRGISTIFADVNNIPIPGDKSETLPSSIPLGGPHLVHLPQDPFLNVAHLNPKVQVFWKPMRPLSSNQRVQAHVPGQQGNHFAHQTKD